ncbi:chromosome partition protein MukB [Vibrio sp. VB16]|uniref:chromosome partition protein MukB n=1 Tax=Vibrio sp. VB16 TaxID=2785746 RepID=UPI00189D9A84|nr:chromosome partition protein MukB [Vibrio sp. VB16]UGA55992.1 chromosome partition protein MukB [Vibrio sp. VB16]
MIERGKYQSLTMINWNGFFARTFDIDDLVTTLSGGNGAGKSTAMAAFITALIPDQTLLHFRNTTEAGSSQTSRDKGLFGKLQPGVCYAALDVINSRKQRVLFGVRLQQVAGRDKKVDIKPFVIQGLPSQMKPTDVLIEALSNNSARVRNINELKQVVGETEGVLFKGFNSVTDYHSQMFEFGVLPKKLRNSSDRSKFYRLIEASLYGGISSAITRSLRDYLLPQNGGVKKAFQDMESALRENRITLDAIKATQIDRDLFKHLLTESTNYVASDYMRHTNDRKNRLDKSLSLRSELFSSRRQLTEQHQLLNSIQEELERLTEQELDLELDHQAASDHLQLVQNALRQKEKIERYIDDLAALNERLEEQMMVVEESQECVLHHEEQAALAEQEVDSLQRQLADYQQALDVQQTRALQYQQAVESLQQARVVFEDPALCLEDIDPLSAKLKQQEQEQTQTLLALKHKLDISSAAAEQFETGLSLVQSIYVDVERPNVLKYAKQAIMTLKDGELLLANESQWLSQFKEIERQLNQQKQAIDLAERYKNANQFDLNDESDVGQESLRHQALIEEIECSLELGRDQRIQLTQQVQSFQLALKQLEAHAPAWIEANNALEQLVTQTEEPLNSRQAVMSHMQRILETEKQTNQEKERLAIRRDQLNQQIEQLASSGGANDARLKDVAVTLGGVLLSEIYDDITLEDAPYFSAMYGPARHAIVVSDLSGVKEKLHQMTDCPEDVYVIEGNVDAFDDSTFDASELEGAVCVQYNERQLRYSRFPPIPLFGRAAREQRLDILRKERDDVLELHSIAAFDSQKILRLYQKFSQFVSIYIQDAFETDPEKEMQKIRARLTETQRELSRVESATKQQQSRLLLSKQAINLLDKTLPVIGYLADDSTIEERRSEVARQLNNVAESKVFISRHKARINVLEGYLSALANDPEQSVSIELEYKQVDQSLQALKRNQFSLADLKERRTYFAYKDSVSMLDESSELSEQLKQKLLEAESLRVSYRASLKLVNQEFNQTNQILVSLKSAYQAKSETVQEFKDDLQELGVSTSEGSDDRARSRKESLFDQLHSSRSRRNEHSRTMTATELEMKSVAQTLKRSEKEYKEIRNIAVLAKSSWCEVLRLAKQHDVERRLYRRELAYLSARELRSMSDKSLGALRLAVADNEELRDTLRASEENAYPERKVLFYIAVYQHLKQRIRQDIIRTDDPVEAIEEMEVELARLSEELTLRENRLAISSDSAASIIKKTIQREQNRIRLLNQGLSNINFGQVKGVRLNVNIRESHETLLKGLAHQQDTHRDLFETSRFTFSEAMAKLFHRVNPHIDMGQRSPQILGEELLDYRNYLELGVEVNRGTDGWLQAESGALSTGEAIGTGQSILLMVVQSWEEESRRLRSKDIVPCRLLFLDEAARLDSKSINTLFELCDRLDMQLLIAAPENISPEQGTTYKLVRKIFKDHEHVHVVGLKGFSNKQNRNQGLQGELLEN